MKVTLREFQLAKQGFDKLLTAPLPILIGFKLIRLTRIANEYLEDIEKQRVKLVEQYGEKAMIKDPTTGKDVETAEVPQGDKMKEFRDEMIKLLDQEVELDGFEPIKISEFEGHLEMTALELASMDKFIC